MKNKPQSFDCGLFLCLFRNIAQKNEIGLTKYVNGTMSPAAAAVATLPPHQAGRAPADAGSHSCRAPASQLRHVAPQHAHPGGGSVGAAHQGEASAYRLSARVFRSCGCVPAGGALAGQARKTFRNNNKSQALSCLA